MTAHDRRSILAICILLPLSASMSVAGELATQGAPGGKIDYVAKLNELVKKGSDESLNAEPFYRKAFALYVESPTTIDGQEIVSWPTELIDERRAALTIWVEANSEALAQLRLGTQRPSYWCEYKGDRVLTADRFSYMSKARLLLWGLLLRAKFETAEGKANDAVADAMASCRFALDLRRRLLLSDQMMGLGASVWALRAEYQMLDKTHLDGTLLQAMQDQLMLLAKDRSWVIDLRGEELAVLDAIQSVYAHYRGEYENQDMGVVDRIVASQWAAKFRVDFGVNVTAEQLRSALLGHTAQELADLVKRGYAYYNVIVSKTPFQWRKEVVDFEEKQREFVGGNLLLSALAPAIRSQVVSSSRCRAERDALITVLALLRYKNDKAGLPVDLEDLVSAGYLAEVPMDPYSEWPLVYRRTEGSFVLYSVGADFRDNGGVHSPKWGEEVQGGDYIFWPVQKE